MPEHSAVALAALAVLNMLSLTSYLPLCFSLHTWLLGGKHIPVFPHRDCTVKWSFQ